MEEREYRITGSICYQLYTYTKKKRTDDEWINKFHKTCSPKDFRSQFTEHGKVTEQEARETFAKNLRNAEIVEIGLVVSKLNPWLGYSPDGIVVQEKKPIALLEIKCPFKGKTASIEGTVASQYNKCLSIEGENIVMKEKHAYYEQIQLGMAVLNLKTTYFVIHSAFDKN